MNLEYTRKLINSVIDNEFAHIQETQEMKETATDFEINLWDQKTYVLYQKLIEVAPEHAKLLDDFNSAATAYWSRVCEYYFKKGVIAGTTNLKFLEKTNVMGSI